MKGQDDVAEMDRNGVEGQGMKGCGEKSGWWMDEGV